MEGSYGPSGSKMKIQGRFSSFLFNSVVLSVLKFFQKLVITRQCSQEVRAVERRILLETLANQLPPESVRFSSKLSKIGTSGNGETLLELENGTRTIAKVSYFMHFQFHC